MSQCHMSDSVYCHRNRKKVNLIDIIDESWKTETLPDDDVTLPQGQGQAPGNDPPDEKDTPAEAKGEEKLPELPLTMFLEEEVDP
mmetsp:Transcript_19773/g.29628  ORF Transcript_19773/g.29628 Transcript_19773/m.29628 type:complete len:85 (-) Transcript_19773:186-440(-)|eukprot:CAMPEP_0194770492 /NCGR_PEP_ID=MMETSP0323_2-20130528/46340_1 /TAXON_ID=2866 ORGANISM="Crypthecodinium cohnii, Strain Seligo" /NCGR_SAMPLE_ID=MMETSP0323_2 /ASSEMBLY_ACC=CAM_ASM_000346 /LENGTH=84 /DNA_ID=CAMNT_0039704067 /DNA_START=35 /DNA_END=289 /DNA_ORIENTATION=+